MNTWIWPRYKADDAGIVVKYSDLLKLNFLFGYIEHAQSTQSGIFNSSGRHDCDVNELLIFLVFLWVLYEESNQMMRRESWRGRVQGKCQNRLQLGIFKVKCGWYKRQEHESSVRSTVYILQYGLWNLSVGFGIRMAIIGLRMKSENVVGFRRSQRQWIFWRFQFMTVPERIKPGGLCYCC